MSGRRDMLEVIQWAEQRGWRVRRTGGGHTAFRLPGVAMPVFASHSPRTDRAAQKTLTHLKRVMRERGKEPTP